MTLRGIDPAKQTMMDALDLAILVEEEAQERYEEFAQQMELHRTFGAAEFFRHMVENEAKHGRELAERRQQRFGAAPRTVTRAMLYDVEAPDYDAARAFMSPRQAMEAAMACEIKAQAFFDGALPAIRDAEVRALFVELRDEEIQHQELVRAELDRLGPDSGLSDEDFVDEPAAQ
jgi:erythrin-vacuolar iron transport family protein